MQNLAKDPFEQFAEENPPEYTPYLDGKNTDKNGNDHPGPGKQYLATGPNYVPFRITSAWVKESQLYDDQVNYMIEFDVQHENFKRAYNHANIENKYILTQTATEQRKKQLQMLSDNGYVGKEGKWVVLQKFGRAYDFRDAQVQGLY